MKPGIAQLFAIYKPQTKKSKKILKNAPSDLTPANAHTKINTSIQAKNPKLKKENSLRCFSVKKKRDNHSYLKSDPKNTQPLSLPMIKSIVPDIGLTSKPEQRIGLLDLSFEDEIKKLDSLMTRNGSARNELLTVQKQMFSLGLKHLISNKRFLRTKDELENISLEQIDESLRDPCPIISYSMTGNKSALRRPKLPPLSLA